MSVFRVFGGKLVSESELVFRRSEIQEMIGGNRSELALRAGKFSVSDFCTAPQLQPLGPGLPLTVQIRHVYSGRFPSGMYGTANLLVTSSIKNLDRFDASAEAINFLLPKQPPRQNLISPPADQNGTPLVCYVPAVTAISTTITFNMVFQRFSDDLLNQLATVFTGASAIPIFVSASPYLVGAGAVLKLAGSIGDAIFNGQAEYSPTVVLNFSDPVDPVQQSGLIVLFKEEDDRSMDPHTLTLETTAGHHGLIDPKTNKLYAGPAPYMVISVDGTRQDLLKSFAPTAASAKILAKFFNMRDGGAIPLAQILDALKALNDVKFRDQANDLRKQIDAAAAAEKPALVQQLAAVIANIQNPDLRPK
jgi:hypothetical protein